MKILCVIITGGLIGYGLARFGYTIDTIIYWIVMLGLNIIQIKLWNIVFD